MKSTDRTAPALEDQISAWGLDLGLSQVGFSSVDLSEDATHLRRWLHLGKQGDMDYMARHGQKRWQPPTLVPQTLSVITVTLDYWPIKAAGAEATLNNSNLAYISRYALGRDYHKVLRGKLKSLAEKIQQSTQHKYRVFVDSAPVLEKALARNGGLGWIGKNTNLINRHRGSLFFIGEIYTDLPLNPGIAPSNHCGSCRACLDICPTDAFDGPYQLDARRCISYLTIEQKGPIPLQFRRAMGNRIFGCDDCQLVCPWNKYAKKAHLSDFSVRHNLDAISLAELFAWTETDFLTKTQGSAIRRIGYEGWLRNIAVALGNAGDGSLAIASLKERKHDASSLVREHVHWALQQQVGKQHA